MATEPSVAPPADPPTPFARMDGAQRLYVALSALFVACLLLGDVIGGKAIPTVDWALGPLAVGGPVSVGIIPFPVTFLLTDVVNDFYGRRGAAFLTLLGAAMAAFAFGILVLTAALPAHPDTYFTQAEYQKVFGGSAQLFVASIAAYLLGQLLDIHVFQFWKALTASRHLWLRATGSTVLSQLIDTVTINAIFWRWTAAKDWGWIGAKAGREYGIKVAVALLLTPAVYALHGLITRGLKIAPAPAEGRERRGLERRARPPREPRKGPRQGRRARHPRGGSGRARPAGSALRVDDELARFVFAVGGEFFLPDAAFAAQKNGAFGDASAVGAAERDAFVAFGRLQGLAGQGAGGRGGGGGADAARRAGGALAAGASFDELPAGGSAFVERGAGSVVAGAAAAPGRRGAGAAIWQGAAVDEGQRAGAGGEGGGGEGGEGGERAERAERGARPGPRGWGAGGGDARGGGAHGEATIARGGRSG